MILADALWIAAAVASWLLFGVAFLKWHRFPFWLRALTAALPLVYSIATTIAEPERWPMLVLTLLVVALWGAVEFRHWRHPDRKVGSGF